ncbi:MAG: hypothetical protein KGL39_42775 [Patescibacteria group bacterium]|nr:hypothetical protein [Patescibacteria group bacterium]
MVLARMYGACRIARAVDLDYKSLRLRVARAMEEPGLVKPTFVELEATVVPEIGESTAHPELRGSFIYGCDTYPLRWKEVTPVLWKNGTKTRRMRLLVLQPTRHGAVGNRGYRRIGYLMATDLKEKAEVLIQAYLSRWEIEVLHRILKADLGIGDHQCNESSVRIYAALAAGYALLALASRQATGEVRSALHHQLPKWQQNYQAWREARRRLAGRPLPVYRATSRDTVALLRKGLAMKWKDGINRCA